MRGAIGRRITNPNLPKQSIFPSSFSFSTSSFGRGRGRGDGGGGGGPINFSSPRVPGQVPRAEDSKGSTDASSSSSSSSTNGGFGHGRGKSIPSTPLFKPSISSFNSSVVTPLAPSGRGCGRAGENQPTTDSSSQSFAPKQPIFPSSRNDEHESDPTSAPQDVHLGKPVPSTTPTVPSVSSFDSNVVTPSALSGRGGGREGENPPTDSSSQSFEIRQTNLSRRNDESESDPASAPRDVHLGKPVVPPSTLPGGGGGQKGENQHTDSSSQSFGPRQPNFSRRTNESDFDPVSAPRDVHLGKWREDNATQKTIFSDLYSVAGRGKTDAKLPGPQEQQVKEENRHFRPPQQAGSGIGRGPPVNAGRVIPKLSQEDAVKQALGILSRGGGDVAGDAGGGRGMSAGGRGRRGGRGSRGGRGRGRRPRDENKDDEDMFYLGNDADGDKFAATVGGKVMNQLTEAFENMSHTVLPSPEMDCYVDALDTDLAFECEPEYMFEEFGRNPDIDETPPIPLRKELEKMKPFLVAYEGIKSQEEWEETINGVMERVPLLRKVVDHYSGPARVTAKRQKERLEKVAKTLPKRAPPSVQKFTSQALLSLQSNPGWGFDKKRQFMKMLTRQVSEQYK